MSFPKYPKYKASGVEWLGDVPEHWEEMPLKALIRLKHGYAFDGSGFSTEGPAILLTPGNFQEQGGFRYKNPEKYYIRDDYPPEFVLKAGDMLVAMTEQAEGLLGSALILPENTNTKFLHNQRLGLVVPRTHAKLNTQFLYNLFNSARYRAEVSVTASGQKVRHTSPQRMLGIRIYLPPVSEQNQIVKVIDAQSKINATLEAEAQRAITLLQERRTALISAAVTGKIDVRGWANDGERDA